MRLLCKQEGDIPEVEAIISLVLGRLGPFWRNQVDRSVEEILIQLRHLETRLPTASVDFLAREGDPYLFLAALMGALGRRLGAPLSSTRQDALKGLSGGLLPPGLDLGMPAAAALLSTTEADLMLQLRGRFLVRQEAIRAHLLEYLTTVRARQAEALWVQELKDLLGRDVTDWLPVTVDAWAYRWYNVGRIVAFHQSGIRTLVLWNPLDKRTSEYCKWAHGREVSTEVAMEHIVRYQEAVVDGDINKTMKLWPLETYGGQREVRLRMLPPYHFRCRTQARAKEGEDVR